MENTEMNKAILETSQKIETNTNIIAKVVIFFFLLFLISVVISVFIFVKG